MGKNNRTKILAVMAVALAGAGWGAWGVVNAQVRQVNMGASMDANPGVGSGGSNQPVQGYVPVNGNDIMTGNVPGLQYFHGSTAITSPFQFQATLGTSNLNSFERQSAGNGMAGGSPLNQVYYLPSATVSSAQGNIYSTPIGSGFESNLIPRSSLSPAASGAQIQALDPGASTSNGAAFNRLGASAVVTDPGAPGAVLSSPIFALREMPMDMSDQNSPDGKTPNSNMMPGSGIANSANMLDSGAAAPPDLRVGQQADASSNSNDQSVKDQRIGESYQGLLDELKKAEAETKTAGNGTDTSTAKGTNPAAANNNIDPLTGGPRQKTQLKKPVTTTQPNSAAIGAALAAEDELKKEAMPAKALADLSTNTLRAGSKLKPMATLVRVPTDGKATPVEQLMLQAEKLLRDGKYLEAAQRYQTALAREPGNALALVGRAHAELGAGMYQSAAYDLKYVFTRNPQMVSVRYQMDQFMPKSRLDYLVSDLKTLEGSKETGNSASFLLSYLYYETGSEQELQAQLARWNARPGHDAWQEVVSKAWSAKASEDGH